MSQDADWGAGASKHVGTVHGVKDLYPAACGKTLSTIGTTITRGYQRAA